MKIAKSPILPIGYGVSLGNETTAEEIVKLHEAVEGHTPLQYDPDAIEIARWMERALCTVGVRDKKRELVGIGFLFGSRKQAQLDDMSVHPEHRHQGIGKFIINYRVSFARSLGIPDIFSHLVATNNLASYYEELGVGITLPDSEEF